MRLPWKTKQRHATKHLLLDGGVDTVQDDVERFRRNYSRKADSAVSLRLKHSVPKSKPPTFETQVFEMNGIPKTDRGRRNTLKDPDALCQLAFVYPQYDIENERPDMVQILPTLRHASSGFPFPPWMEEYGITNQD